MVKVRVSYTKQEELEEVSRLLKPMLKNVKTSKNEQGKFKKAYIEP